MTDIKLDKSKGYWDISFEKNDIAKVSGLDTAIYMSVFCEKRATNSMVSNPVLRRGHFSNIFYENYEIGSYAWYYSQQPKTESNRSLLEDSIKQGLQWLIDDSIISEIDVTVSITKNGYNIDINTIADQQSNYYDLFIKTWQ